MYSNLNYFYKKLNYNFLENKLTSNLRNFNNSQFIDFFKKLNLNVPQVLNKTPSIHRLKNLNTLNVLPKYLFRHGLKERSRKLVLISKHKSFYWKVLFLNLSTFFKYPKNGMSLILNSNNSNLIHKNFELKDLLSTNCNVMNLLFSFYIYKVDKHIYKNSRGRSGKFTFIWKYLPPYKRVSRIVYWLLKDVRTTPGKTLQERLNTVLFNFLRSPHNSLIWKIKKFSLNYGYYNLRHSLLETYRTSTR